MFVVVIVVCLVLIGACALVAWQIDRQDARADAEVAAWARDQLDRMDEADQ